MATTEAVEVCTFFSFLFNREHQNHGTATESVKMQCHYCLAPSIACGCSDTLCSDDVVKHGWIAL